MHRKAAALAWTDDPDYHPGNGRMGYLDWMYPSDDEIVADRNCIEYSGLGDAHRDGRKLGCNDSPAYIRPAHPG